MTRPRVHVTFEPIEYERLLSLVGDGSLIELCRRLVLEHPSISLPFTPLRKGFGANQNAIEAGRRGARKRNPPKISAKRLTEIKEDVGRMIAYSQSQGGAEVIFRSYFPSELPYFARFLAHARKNMGPDAAPWHVTLWRTEDFEYD